MLISTQLCVYKELACCANAGSARDGHAGFRKEAEPSVGVLIPMPSASALASISTDEAFAAAPEEASLVPEDAGLGTPKPRAKTGDAGSRDADQNMGVNTPLPALPRGHDLPLMVCPQNLTFSCCEVSQLPLLSSCNARRDYKHGLSCQVALSQCHSFRILRHHLLSQTQVYFLLCPGNP